MIYPTHAEAEAAFQALVNKVAALAIVEGPELAKGFDEPLEVLRQVVELYDAREDA